MFLRVVCIHCDGEWFEIENDEVDCCPHCKSIAATGACFLDD